MQRSSLSARSPGVAAPEGANNAETGGAMVPMLTLGIPGSGTTAILLAAFILWGLKPGPLMIQENPQLFWGLVASMYVGNVILLILNIPLIPLFYLVGEPPTLLGGAHALARQRAPLGELIGQEHEKDEGHRDPRDEEHAARH